MGSNLPLVLFSVSEELHVKYFPGAVFSVCEELQAKFSTWLCIL